MALTYEKLLGVQKDREERIKETAKKVTGSSSSSKSSSSKASSSGASTKSYAQQFFEDNSKAYNWVTTPIAPITKAQPTVTTSAKKTSYFDDGYDFGDITKTILGTALKATNSVAKKTSNAVSSMVSGFQSTTSAFENSLHQKYSSMSLSELESELDRIEKEEKLFKDTNGGKFTNYLAKVGSYLGESSGGASSSAVKAQSQINIDKLNDYTKEKEILNTYRKQRATEEYLGGLSEEQLQMLDTIAEGEATEDIAPIYFASNPEVNPATYYKATQPATEAAEKARATLQEQLKAKNPGKTDEELNEIINNAVELRKNQVNAEEQAKTNAQMQELANEHSVAAFLLSRGVNLLGGATGLAELYLQRDNEYGLDINAPGFTFTNASNAIDEQIQLDHDWEIEGVDAFDFFYKAGTGIVDNVARVALSGGNTAVAGTMMFAQGTTQSIIEGKKKGYSDSKALALGLLDGTFEAISEKLSLDTILGSKGGALKTLAKSFVAEGSEELTSNWLNRIADEIANGNHSELSKMYEAYISVGYSKSEALAEVVLSVIGEDTESFLIGGIAGSVMGGGVAIANRNAVELTDIEQKVFDKVVEDKIAEAVKENGGNALSKKEETEIRNATLRELQRGYIDTDTIESVLGGEEYETYKRVSDKGAAYKSKIEEAIEVYQAEYDTLGKMKRGEMTREQIEREAKLKETLEQLKAELETYESDSTKRIGGLKTKLGQNVSEMVKGSRLAESYLEIERENQLFKADYSKYKGTKYEEAAKKTLENAIKGKVNNTNRMRDIVEMNAKFSAETGVVFDYKDGEQIKNDFIERQTKEIAEIETIPEAQRTEEQRELLAEMKDILSKVQSGALKVNGDVTSDGITINLDSPKAFNVTTGHEITHLLEKANAYEPLKKALFQYAKSKGVDVDGELLKISAKYRGVKNANPEAELVADLVGDYLFTDYDFVKHLSADQSLFQKAYDGIKYLCKMATAGSKEARELERVKRNFEKAYKESANASGTKLSLSEIVDQNNKSYASGESYYTMSYKKDGKVVGTVEYGEYEGQPNVKMIEVEPEYRRRGIGTKLLQELQKKYPDKEIEFGMSTPDGTKLLESITYDVTDEAVVSDGERLKALQTELNDLQEKLDVLYDTENPTETDRAEVDKLGNRWNEVYDTIRELEQSLRGKRATKTFVKTDTKYSLSETENNYNEAVKNKDIETAQKIVDEVAKKNGYTIKAYHGGDKFFTVFGKGNKTSQAPEGVHFFSSNKDVAYSYTTYKRDVNTDVNSYPIYKQLTREGTFEENRVARGGVYSSYLKLENPYVVDFKGEYYSQKIDGRDINEIAVYARDNGYDGVIAKNIKDPGDMGDANWESKPSLAVADDYIVFDSKQIKSAEAITYDDNGNVIPLSERFKAENNDIRYSLSTDSEGNKLTEKQSEYFAQSKVVDRNGNLLKVYHTTKNDFTVFDKAKKGEATEDANTYLGFFFTDDAEHMQNFPEFEGGKTEAYYLDMKNPIDMTDISEEAFLDIVEVMGGDVDEATEVYVQELADEQDRAKLRGDNRVSLTLGNLLDALTGEFYYDDFIRELQPNYDTLMSKGYDGVINYMDELLGIKEYIVLDSNQAKLTSNKNPSGDADVRYSLSENNKQGFAPTNSWLVYGKNARVKQPADIAPTAETEAVAENATATEPIAPVQEVAQPTVSETEKIGTVNEADYAPMSEAEAVAMWNEQKGNIDTLTDADAPPVTDAPIYSADTTSLDSKTLSKIANTVSGTLSLSRAETKAIQDIIQRYSTSEIQNEADLFEAIKAQFGEKSWAERNEEIATIKQVLRNYRISVSPAIKRDITDYAQFMKRNFNKIAFSKDGLEVDKAYMELSAYYPHLFPESITNATDQLLQIAEVANMEVNETKTDVLDDQSIQEAVELIVDVVTTYKENELLKLTKAQGEEFLKNIKKYEKEMPVFGDDFAPTISETTAPSVISQEEVAPTAEEPTPQQTEEAPDAESYIKKAAEKMLEDLNGSTYGERRWDAEEYYRSGGSKSGWYYENLKTSREIEELIVDKDYNKHDIEDALNAIIEGNSDGQGAAGDVKAVLERMLREGYTDFLSGEAVQPDSGYLGLFAPKQEAVAPTTAEAPIAPEATAPTESYIFNGYDLSDETDDVAPVKEVEAPKAETVKAEAFDAPVAPARETATETEDVSDGKSPILERYEQNINTVLKEQKEALKKKYDAKKEKLQLEIENKDAYISKKALALYEELKGLRKGVRASKELGSLLDYKFNWNELKSTLLKVSRFSETLNPESAIEEIVRDAINRDYESKATHGLENLDAEYARKVARLEEIAKNKIEEIKANIEANAERRKGETIIGESQTVTKEPATKKKGLWSDFVRNFVSKGAVFETTALKTKNRALEDKYKMWKDRSEAKAQYFMEHGKGDVKSLKSIVDTVQKSGLYKEFDLYMKHRLNVDRMKVDKPVFGYDVTADMSMQTAGELQRKHPEFAQWAKDVYKYNNHLTAMMVDAGIISRDTALLWAKQYPNYIPLERLTDDGTVVSGDGVGISAPVKRATGGNTSMEYLLKTMAHRTSQVFKAVDKNAFGVELKNTLKTETEGSEATTGEAIEDLGALDDGLLQAGTSGKNPTFTVFENGERVTFEISEEMYKALQPTSEGLTRTFKPLNAASSLHKKVLTEYNLFFTARNFPKDAQDVIFNSKHAAKTYANMPVAVAELLNGKGKYVTEYWENGGKSNTYFDSKTNDFFEEDGAVKKVLGFVPNGISKVNDFVEAIPRLAEYIASRKSGATIEAAMLDSARVTTDFSDGGDVAKFMNRNGFTFLNASVQGAAQQVRNIRQAKAEGFKGMAKLVGKYAISGLPALLFNHLLWDDDEEYEELSEYVKDNYYVIGKYGDGQFVRIPKGRMAAVVQEVADQAYNILTGEVTGWDGAWDSAKSVYESVMNNIAPSNPIDNNVIAPIAQAISGKTWYGEDLVPTRLQDVPAREQYDETIDSISKWLGENTGISPYKINYLLNQYSGFVGDMILPGLTPEAERGDTSALGNLIAPLKDQFVVDAVVKNRNPSDFFSLSDELEVNANSKNATDEDKLKQKYISSVSSELSELYKQKREIQNSNLSDELKYKQVRDIQAQINELAKKGLESYDTVRIDRNYATVGGVAYKLNDEGKWQKITDEQLEKQNEAIGILGISPSEYWNNKQEYDMQAFYPEKYAVLQQEGISVAEYKEKYEDSVFYYNDDFSWAANNPDKYTFSKAITDNVIDYRNITSELYAIRADKDENGNSISGSAKEKKQKYIWGLDIDEAQKYILFKNEYNSYDDHNQEIVDYVLSRDDLSVDEKKTILETVGFTIDADGTIRD